MTEPEQRPQAPLDTERVRAHARRVLDSESFSKAHSLRRFLAYVVDETLAGRADSLKEYAIGVEVFGRGEGFDPRADTIVRVQARRLRSKLEQYYAARGYPDGIAIHVPTGSYLPRFREVPVAAPPPAAAAGPDWMWPPRDAPRAAPGAPLPVPRTTLIGREAEVAAILGALRAGGSRVLTLARAGRERQDAAGAAGRGGGRRRFPGRRVVRQPRIAGRRRRRRADAGPGARAVAHRTRLGRRGAAGARPRDDPRAHARWSSTTSSSCSRRRRCSSA